MKRRVLCIDDSPTQRALVSTLLTRAGYEVRVCPNGEEGLVEALRAAPDLLVSDVNMPNLDGYSLCRRLKAEPSTTHVPVVLFTKLGDPRDILKGLEAGADGFIIKGTNPEELLRRVQSLLETPDEQLQQREDALRETVSRLRLSESRRELFKLLFEAMRREVPVDLLAFFADTPGAPLVTVSVSPLAHDLSTWLVEETKQAYRLLNPAFVDSPNRRLESVVLDAALPPTSLEGGPPKSAVRVPLYDDGRALGSFGVYAHDEAADFAESIRFFFDLGVESARTLGRIPLGS